MKVRKGRRELGFLSSVVGPRAGIFLGIEYSGKGKIGIQGY